MAVTAEKEISAPLIHLPTLAEISTPPETALKVLERFRQEGFTFKPILWPNETFTRKSAFWKGKKAPHRWYWDQIKEGKIDRSAAALLGNWALIESVEKPDYDGGRQMYYDGSDPLEEALSAWRSEEKIKIPSWARNIPSNSRFGVSASEVDSLVSPHIANLLGVDKSYVNGLRLIEFNYAGNLFYPQWGSTRTLEWLADRFESADDLRLLGGSSSLGGLAHVLARRSDVRSDSLGFRLKISFPSNA